MGLTKAQKVVLVPVIIFILLIVWGLFPLFFKWVMIGIGTGKTKIEDFGTLGDIYGSLNTLFTSATLIIVMYSAYLQRQANKDARKAMADQLKQARDATAKQLRQARQSTKQQLELAQDSHDAQLAESKYAVFSSMFNILLNEKNKSLERLAKNLGDHSTNDLFQLLGKHFVQNICKDWKEYQTVKDENDDFLYKEFTKLILENYESKSVTTALSSYLYLYISLIQLIKNSDLKTKDKDFFYDFLSNSMIHHEQSTLLWFSSCAIDVRHALYDTGLIDTRFSDKCHYFIFRNFDISIFRDSHLIDQWEKILQEKNPA